MSLSKDLYEITPDVIVEKDYSLSWRSLSETVSRIIEPDKDLLKQRMWSLTDGRSFWSGKRLTEKDQFGRWMDPKPGTVEWDHLIPAYKGGLSVSYNLLPSTREENQLKSGMDPLSYYRFRKALEMDLPWDSERDFLTVLESLNGIYFESLDGVFCYMEDEPLPGQLMKFLIDHQEDWAPSKKYPYWQDVTKDREDFPDLCRLSHFSHPSYAKDSRGKRTLVSRRKKVSKRFGKMIRIFLELYPDRCFYDLTHNEWMVVARELKRRADKDPVSQFYIDELIAMVERARQLKESEASEKS